LVKNPNYFGKYTQQLVFFHVNIMTLAPCQQNLFNWFMRRATNSAIRRVAELPIAIATDVGLVRTENQDRAAILRIQLTENRSSIVVVLCDGMGGMSDGAECACFAIATFLSSCVQNANLPLQERIVIAVKNANDTVFSKYNGRGGATLSAFIADSQDGILGVNVGDSRIYLIENGKLSQITFDDTIAGQFAQENENIPGRNELLQYVGMGQGIEPHIIAFPQDSLLSNILLTSDGVHFLDKNIMESVIRHASNSALAVKRLIELSKWCGGHDNASGIIVTNISAMLIPKLNANLGDIEVWDAFGEIQFIDIQTPSASVIKPKDNEVAKVSIDKKTKPIRKRTPILKNKPIATQKKKAKNTEKDHAENKKPIPQLQIDFDVN
jgi:PPM family protein phosphatase